MRARIIFSRSLHIYGWVSVYYYIYNIYTHRDRANTRTGERASFGRMYYSRVLPELAEVYIYIYIYTNSCAAAGATIERRAFLLWRTSASEMGMLCFFSTFSRSRWSCALHLSVSDVVRVRGVTVFVTVIFCMGVCGFSSQNEAVLRIITCFLKLDFLL